MNRVTLFDRWLANPPASVGRNPEGHDPKGHGAEHEHAVGAEGDETPKGSRHA